MKYKLCELYRPNKYTILSKYKQNTHFIQIAPCFRWSFHCSGMLQVRENEISLCNSSGGPEFLRTLGKHCWRCNANGWSQNALSFQNYKENAPCYGNNHKKRFVGSNSQVY